MGQNKRYYRAKARSWVLGETDKGNPQIAVSFEILDEGAPSRFLSWWGYFSDQTWERTVESLRYMGWKGEDVAEVDDSRGGLDANEVSLVVEDEEYPAGSGQWSPKVQWVNRAAGAAVKTRLTEDKKKSFAAQMRDKIRAMDAANGTSQRPARPPVAKPQQAAAPAQDNFGDDIPF